MRTPSPKRSSSAPPPTIRQERTNSANLPLNSSAAAPNNIPLTPRTTTGPNPPPKPPRSKGNVANSNQSYHPTEYFPLYPKSIADQNNSQKESKNGITYATLAPARTTGISQNFTQPKKPITYLEIASAHTDADQRFEQLETSIASREKTSKQIEDTLKRLTQEYNDLIKEADKISIEMGGVIKSVQGNLVKQFFSKADTYNRVVNLHDQIKSEKISLEQLKNDLEQQLKVANISPGRKLLDSQILREEVNVQKLINEFNTIADKNQQDSLINDLARVYKALYTPRDGIEAQLSHVKKVGDEIRDQLSDLRKLLPS